MLLHGKLRFQAKLGADTPRLAMVDLSEGGAASVGHNRDRQGSGSGNNDRITSKKSRTRRGKRGKRRRNKKNNRNKTPPPYLPPEVATLL